MSTGMLWYDSNPKNDLLSQIAQAAAYYQYKYGQYPELCYVHPDTLGDSQVKTHDITVLPDKQVQPGHLWLGVRDGMVPLAV
ncbi:MAG TPA: hypothetical protein VF338_11635 [Leptolinea sp.]